MQCVPVRCNALLTLCGKIDAMRWLSVPCLLCLIGCNAPSLEFRGLPATRVTVEGAVFDVRHRDTRAEAIRINPQYAPRLGPLGAQAAVAMRAVSGCAVTKIRGDAAVMHGKLECGSGPRPRKIPPVLPRRAELDCYSTDSFESAATGEIITYYDCDVIWP